MIFASKRISRNRASKVVTPDGDAVEVRLDGDPMPRAISRDSVEGARELDGEAVFLDAGDSEDAGSSVAFGAPIPDSSGAAGGSCVSGDGEPPPDSDLSVWPPFDSGLPPFPPEGADEEVDGGVLSDEVLMR